MRVKLIKPEWTMPSKDKKAETLPAGTTIEHADAYWLVAKGTAVPDDDECQAKVDEMALTHGCFRKVKSNAPVVVTPAQAAAQKAADDAAAQAALAAQQEPPAAAEPAGADAAPAAANESPAPVSPQSK